jgi:hypothetical protein
VNGSAGTILASARKGLPFFVPVPVAGGGASEVEDIGMFEAKVRLMQHASSPFYPVVLETIFVTEFLKKEGERS